MTNLQISYFLKTIEEGSFTDAAKAMFVSQQVVSRQVSLLENELGVKLFTRVGHRLDPTSSGMLMYETFRRQRIEMNAAISQAHQLQVTTKTIRLGIVEINKVFDYSMVLIDRDRKSVV